AGGRAPMATLLHASPPRCPPAVLTVQHIAPDFAPSLARWLEGQGSLPVRLARAGDELRPGEVLLAATSDHLVLGADRRLAYTADPVDYPYRPSVDVFFHSLASAWARLRIAVLLTGLGSHGAQRLLRLRGL